MEEYLNFKNAVLKRPNTSFYKATRESEALIQSSDVLYNRTNTLNPQVYPNISASYSSFDENSYSSPPYTQVPNRINHPNNPVYVQYDPRTDYKLNTSASVNYGTSNKSQQSATGKTINQQKAKFFAFALQKFVLKTQWNLFMKKLEQYNIIHSVYYPMAPSLSKTLPLDEVPDINDSRSFYYSELAYPRTDGVEFPISYIENIQASAIQQRNSQRSIQSFPMNHRAKNTTYSAILHELQNDWTVGSDLQGEMLLPKNSFVLENQHGVHNYEINQPNRFAYMNRDWNHNRSMESYNPYLQFKNSHTRTISQQELLNYERDVQNINVITRKTSPFAQKILEEKDCRLFCLFLKKSIDAYQKRWMKAFISDMKEYYQRSLEVEKEIQEKLSILLEKLCLRIKIKTKMCFNHWRDTAKEPEVFLEPIETYEGSNILEYSYRSLLSPNNHFLPGHTPLGRHKVHFSLEAVNRERKLKGQYLVAVLKRVTHLHIKEAFVKISVFNGKERSQILNEKGALVIARILENKVNQGIAYSIRKLQATMEEKILAEEKAECMKKIQYYQTLIVGRLLRRAVAERKNQVFGKWKEFLFQAREADYQKKDISLSENLTNLMKKYRDMANHYERINKKYEEFCQNPKKVISIETTISSPTLAQPLQEKDLENKTYLAAYKTSELLKAGGFSRAKYKLMADLTEIIYQNHLKNVFTQIKSHRSYAKPKEDNHTRKPNHSQSLKAFQSDIPVYFDIKDSTKKSFEIPQQIPKKKTEEKYSTDPNQNTDLLSAINFLKAL